MGKKVTAPETQLLIRQAFKTLLADPQCKNYEKNFLWLHVVRAIGTFGPPALELLPDLCSIRGTDTILDNAIDDARQKVQAKPAAVAPDAKPKQPGKHADALDKLKTGAVADQLGAASSLGSATKADADAADVLNGLLTMAKKTDADANVRIVAMGSAKKVADALGKTKTDYLNALTDIVPAEKDAQVFAAVARSLADLKADAKCALLALQVRATDSDPDIQAAAKNASAAIVKAATPAKAAK
jgi:hypothetical protein